MEVPQRLIFKGIVSACIGGIFYYYVYGNDRYYVPYEIVLLLAIVCFGFSLYNIAFWFYYSLTLPEQTGPVASGDQRFPNRDGTSRMGSFGRGNMGPNYQGQSVPYYDDRIRTGIYTHKAEEMAEAFMRKQAAKNQPERKQPGRSFDEPTHVFGFNKTYDRIPSYGNPLNIGPQYDVDQGINCNRDGAERPFLKSGLFHDLPTLNRDSTGLTNRFAHNSFSDEYTSRRESMMRVNPKASTSVNRTPWGTERSVLSLNRSASPILRGDSEFYTARPLMKKSTVMLKESTSLYSGADKRSMHNYGNYDKAMESVTNIGGDPVTFNQSIKNLHNWISHKLLDKYYEENKVWCSVTLEKHDRFEQPPV